MPVFGGMHVIYLFCSLLLATAHSGDVRRPPSIVKNPVEMKDFRVGEDVKLECVATGHPTPEYTWYHNNYEIRPPGQSGNIQLLAPGLVQLNSLTALDEGYYHCMASNQYGSVYSNSSQLRHGKISEGIQGQTSPTNHTAIEGKPYSLECFKANSVPSPIYTWCLTDYSPNDKLSAKQTCLAEDKRIQVDDEGTLHFMYVQKSDNRNGQVYKCNAHNTAVDTTKGGAYARLNVQENAGGIFNSKPSPIFSSGPQVVVLEGQELTLKCFFSGFPVGTMAWTRSSHGNTPNPLPSGRVQYSNSGYTVKISRVEPSDAGEYNCAMSNSEGSSIQVISVEVHARPTITSNLYRPMDQNLTEGDTAVFNCSPHAFPLPKITWYRNNEVLNVDNLPMRMTISPDNTRLTVRDVRRDPVDIGGVQDGSDLGVIQCLVENKHGKVFYSGFLNVLKKTKMTRIPSGNMVSAREGNTKSHIFLCDATTDDSTPLSLKWYFSPSGKEDAFENLYPYPDKITIKEGNKSVEITVRNSSDWNQHGGHYKCVADNGYSKVESIAVLHVEVPPTTITPEAAESKEASFPWWIILLVCLICLLLLLILFCCWCCYRNRGREYKVDKNERKSGNDPIKELSSTAFADYQRPSTDPLRGSRASLGSSIKMDSDDEGSLNEYGDIDAGKFGEDGSFIGDYNSENRRNHSGYHRV